MESRAWYLLALLPLVVFGGLTLAQCRDYYEKIDGMPRMVVPGTQTFELAAGDYIVYGESESEVAGKRYENSDYDFDTPCTVVDAGNQTVELTSRRALKYGTPTYRGKSMYKLTLPIDGRYTFRCGVDDGSGTAVLAIGEPRSLLRQGAMLISILATAVPTMMLLWFVYGRRQKAIVRALVRKNMELRKP